MSDTLAPSLMHLPIGTMLGEYRISGVIGQGGFSIVYLAYEASLDRTVAIKEFFPNVLAQRSSGLSVAVVTVANQSVFKMGLESFLREAKLQAKFFHPALVEVIRVWEQNNSAYISMRYHRGQNLRDLRRAHADMSAKQIWAFISPVLDALSLLHSHDVIHRDVSPDNILIRESGEPVLLDLGAARTVVAGMTQALTTVLKPGYAPLEQYADDGALEQGPWTDVYGIAAVVYFLYVGSAPPQAVTRIVSDSLAGTEMTQRIPDALRPVLRQALAVLPQHRYQTIAAFRSGFLDGMSALAIATPFVATNASATELVSPELDSVDGESTIVIPPSFKRGSTNNRSMADLTDDSTLAPSAKVAPLGLRAARGAIPSNSPPVVEGLEDAANEDHETIRLAAATQSTSELPKKLQGSPKNASTLKKLWGIQSVKYGVITTAFAIALATTISQWPERTAPQLPPAAAIVESKSTKAEVAEVSQVGNSSVAASADSAVTASNKSKTQDTPAASVRPSVGRPPKQSTQPSDSESTAWDQAASSASSFALMAYLGKYPAGKHAEEATRLLRTPQRSSEGCLLRYPAVRQFAWSGKCSGGMAVGEGVLKWEAQRRGESGLNNAVAVNEARGTLKNGIMVGRWTVDVRSYKPAPRRLVNMILEFDFAGNLSIQQRHRHQDGSLYVGETNASMKNYFGERHGVGVFTYPENSRFKRLTGRWVDGELDGEGKLEFADGTALSGSFLRGAHGFNGVVKKLNADGSFAETQMWRKGKPEGSDTSPLAGF